MREVTKQTKQPPMALLRHGVTADQEVNLVARVMLTPTIHVTHAWASWMMHEGKQKHGRIERDRHPLYD